MIPILFFHFWLTPQTVTPAQPILPSSSSAEVEAVLQSGRVAQLGDSPSARVSVQKTIAPGLPPLLSFRYYEGRLHHRFGNNDLVLDDAGH
jgi:hypothetical protein